MGPVTCEAFEKGRTPRLLLHRAWLVEAAPAREGRTNCGGDPGGLTLTPGQTFYEGPDDVHVVDRNASTTKPAKFLVFIIKAKGAPALVPAE